MRMAAHVVLAILIAAAAASGQEAGPGTGSSSPGPATASATPKGDPSRPKLTDLTLEELMNVETTSVTRKPQRRQDAPAALYVITREDIRRSGVRTIPDALRMVPGVHVARVDANKYAVGIRGFTARLSRAIMVNIDGRNVYTPFSAGVQWEEKDILLDDVERIEVIRGPGGTLWGANAVNGVINITTRSSKDTRGALAKAGAGTEERGFFDARYGDAISEDWTWRAYGKLFNRDPGYHATTDDWDDWKQGQMGFRSDLDATANDVVTVQGDFYHGVAGERVNVPSFTAPFNEARSGDARLAGGNLLGRWVRTFSKDSDLIVTAYWDHTYRRSQIFREDRDTYDGEFQHRFPLPLGVPQEVIWGGQYRVSQGSSPDVVDTVTFDPTSRTDHLVSGFVQDEIAIVPETLKLWIGTKVEYNSYSGFEVQPSGRIALYPAPRHTIWAAASRAVRTPTRVEHDLALSVALDPAGTTFARVVSDKDWDPEILVAYEGGYRFQVLEALALDLAGFAYRYDELLSVETGAPFAEPGPPPRLVVPFVLANTLAARTYGGEVGASFSATDWWQLHGTYAYLNLELRRIRGGTDSRTERQVEGSSPQNQATLRSYMDLPKNFELDAFLRYVDSLPSQGVRHSFALDLRLGWRPTEQTEIAIVGQNLIDGKHPEFGGSPETVEVQRGFYAAVTWRF